MSLVATQKRRIYLYSPIPPVKSGTAHYFDLLMTQVRELDLTSYDITVVVDKKFYDSTAFSNPEYDLADYHQVKRNPGDISIYFLANNEFHRYVHRAVYDHRPTDGMAVSVVHEPCMWMNVQAMCMLREYGFDENDLQYFAAYEFGDQATRMSELFKKGATDSIFEYTSLAGTHIYEHSDVIVFHSQFAQQKFIIERSESYTSNRQNEPLYLIMQHPPEEILQHVPERGSRTQFVAGTYGWVQKTKQTDSIIAGFNDFYSQLSGKEKDEVMLHVVGQVNATKDFDPVSLARKSSACDKIEFFGYVSDQKLDELMAESSLVFSLRFPSCGETSGPLYKANALGVPVVLSDYAAFAEEPADYHVPVEKALQHEEIVRILQEEFAKYKKNTKRPVARHEPFGMTIGQVLDRVLVYQI